MLAKQELLFYIEDNKINELFEEQYAIDIAKIVDEYDDEELNFFVEKLNFKQLASLIEQSKLNLAKRILDNLEVLDILDIFSYMSKDDIVDVLGEIKVSKQKAIINSMKDSDKNLIKTLLSYKEDSAGGIMTTEYCQIKSDMTIKKAIETIKKISPKTEVIDTIFVVDNNKVLKGIINLRDLLTSKDDDIVFDVMNDNIVYVYPHQDQEEVASLVSKYDLHAIAVVNQKRQMLGIVTVDDIIDVIVQEHSEDMMLMAGVSQQDNLNSSILISVKHRLPWLLINLLTAFLAAFTVNLFSDVIAKVVVLAAINPIIAGMGGNAGAQGLSVTIRAIALGEADLKKSMPLFYKQVFIGLYNGLTLGLITGGLIAYVHQNIYLLVIVLLAMMINLVLACVMGFLIPLVLQALKIDPAISSSIFLTTVTDVCGFFVFLGLASLFLDKLI